MKKNTIKQTIILSVISILGVALFIGGSIFTDSLSRANPSNTEPKKEKMTLIKNVPTSAQLSKLANVSKKKEKIVSVNNTKDTTAPTIIAPEETIEQNAQVNVYDEVTAVDNKDGDLTAKITTEENLDTSVLGTQTVHFSATDASGNTGVADRIFHIIPKNEPVANVPQAEQGSVNPEPIQAEPTPETTTTAVIEPTYGATTLTLNGQTIPYQNGGQGSGQSIIDSNPGGLASTWGGAAVQSGDDGQNTHFIGHNPGVFSTVFSLNTGSQIVVTDANGTPTTYTVRTLLQLDDYGAEVGTGTNYWDLVVGTGGGERITLQSCINDDVNLFVIAYK
ncbi:immunoglobulin-like domain-containing protein [Enterococcus sp. AZ101]|uniref:immunoglobulin-like domain-containing protein n=1 Tax=Enterococcus sp. AZ101 TaxID=2774742 RepID=UPI003D29A6FE